jgi:hypothetical protein
MSQNDWATIIPFGPMTNFLLAQNFFSGQPSFQALKDGEIRMMNWYLVLLFSLLDSEIKSTSGKRNVVKCQNGLG